MSLDGRLIVVSNRLPFSVTESETGLRLERSSGGLVSALLPLLKRNGRCWIGWPGTSATPEIDDLVRTQCNTNYSLQPVFLSAEEKKCFYHGCSNEIIWPLFHDLPSRCTFDPRYWTAYREANEKFAHATAQVVEKEDFIWVHDYHLMLLARALRGRSLRNEIGYFHHIPFPQPDIFEKLPWRTEIVRALLTFDSIGFQTDRDRRNFLACVRRLVPEAHVQKSDGKFVVQAEGTYTTIGSYPIGIDFDDLASCAVEKGVTVRAHQIREEFPGCRLIVGVDRLDYTKGIVQRLLGLRTLLKTRPEWVERVTIAQVVVPSREEIPDYRALKEHIEQLVAEINEEFATPNWSPISYLHGSLSKTDLLALYRAADIALVTPLKDGMNLVAKEFCASRVDEAGVLVLSEFAGAAVELSCGALLVNPYDCQGIAAALAKGLQMSRDQQQVRMQRMREVLGHNNIFEWCRTVCSADAPWLKQARRSSGIEVSGRMAQYAARAM